jgi:hypothetical protein
MTDKPMTVADVIELLKARKLEYYHMMTKSPPLDEMSPREQEEQMSIRGGEIAINWILEKIGEGE